MDRTAGDVARRAISRPSSVMRPCSSVMSSLIGPRSASDWHATLSCSFSFSCPLSLVRSFSLSTSQRSTSPMRSSRARTWETVQRSSFSKRLAIVNSVPGTSSVPEGVNDVYMGGCSRAGDPPGEVPRWREIGERLMGCGTAAGDSLTGVLSGVGDVGEDDARGAGPPGGILRLRYAGSAYLLGADRGQSLSFPLALFCSFSVSFERDLASTTTCWAGVRGSLSLVGVSLDFAACHQPVTPSLADEAGEGGLGRVWDLPRGGGNEWGEPEFIMANTRSSIARRSSASLVSIRSASRRLWSRSR